jgi:hypothetical protein
MKEKLLVREQTLRIDRIVDDLGELKAVIAELEVKEKKLIHQLVDLGVGPYEGALFRATVSQYDRDTLDMNAVREKLSPQFIKAHTRTTVVNKVNVYAKTGVGLDALVRDLES